VLASGIRFPAGGPGVRTAVQCALLETAIMTLIREPAVAGMFYPDNPRTLREQLEAFLAGGNLAARHPKALIVPHAGYIYSGPVAASAYRLLRPLRETIERVVLLGPSHRVAFAGIAATRMEYFSTPIGLVRIDREATDRALALPQVSIIEQAHREEHSLEVQLPFLQTVLGEDFGLVPLVVGDAAGDSVAEVIEALWGGSETLILISSDLSHYHDYETARRQDEATSRAIETLDPQAIHYEDACGRNPVNGLLVAARHHDLHATRLDLRNSGDTAGGHDRVVGYGAYAFV
jgi:AmmeMemoRadiSam system protein B